MAMSSWSCQLSDTMRHSTADEVRRYISYLLNGIHEQQQNVIAAVNDITKKADVSANVLFERQDDHQVFQCFPAVVNQLELYLNQLITVYTQLEEKDKDKPQKSESNSVQHSCSALPTSDSDQHIDDSSSLLPLNSDMKVKNYAADLSAEQLSTLSTSDGRPVHELQSSHQCASKEDLKCKADDKSVHHYQPPAQDQHAVPMRRKLRHLLQSIADSDVYMLDNPSIDAELKLLINYGLGPELPEMCFKENNLLEVSVTEVTDPSLFWLQIHSTRLLELADALMLYNVKLTNSDWGYNLRCEPQLDMIVCTKLSESDVWYRARIVSLSPPHAPGNVEVFCVDYGKREYTSLDSIRPLHPKFATLPCHSFNCALSEIGPLTDKSVWPPDISEYFTVFVHSFPVFLAFISIHHICPPYLVQLYIIDLFTKEKLKHIGDLMSVVIDDVSECMLKNKKASLVSNELVVTLYYEALSKIADRERAEANRGKVWFTSAAPEEYGVQMDSRHANLLKSDEPEADLVQDVFDSLLDDAMKESISDQESDTVVECEATMTAGNRDPTMPQASLDCAPRNGNITNSDFSERRIGNKEECEDLFNNKSELGDRVLSSGERCSADAVIASEDTFSAEQLTFRDETRTELTVDVESPKDIVPYNTNVLDSVRVDSLLEQQQTGYNPQEITVPSSGYITFLVSFVQSPKKFWIHVLSKESQLALDRLTNELNEYFSVDDKTAITADKLEMDGLCCAKFQDDDTLYRAKIVGLRYSCKKRNCSWKKPEPNVGKTTAADRHISDVLVLYIDFGNTEWVPVTDVYPVPPRLKEIVPQAVCCSLVGVCPVKPMSILLEKVTSVDDEVTILKKPDKCDWPAKSTKVFLDMVGFERPLVGHVTGFDAHRTIRPDTESPLPLVVVDTSGSENIYIAEELIRQGYAASTEVVHLPGENYNVPEEVSNSEEDLRALTPFQPSLDDYLSEKNSYLINVDDPAVVAFGYKPKDEKRICFYYDQNGHCRRGENCPFEHVRTRGLITTDKKAVFAGFDPSSCIETPVVNSWVALEITTVLNPAQFYAIFPFGTKPIPEISEDEKYKNEDPEDTSYDILNSLEALNEAMNEKYSRIVHRDTDYTVYGEGEIVACRFTQDDHFYRARILSLIPENHEVLVFYVDYGNREWVSESSIRQMVPQFMLLPFQAIECRMPLKPVGSGMTWSSKSDTRFFKEFVEGKVLCAKILDSGSSGFLIVDLYDTTGEDIHINQYLIDTNIALPSCYPVGIPASKHSSTDIQLLQPRMLPG